MTEIPTPGPICPLVKSSGLYLSIANHCDHRYFARVFRDTWRLIPLRDRRRAVRYWQDHRPEYLPAGPTPIVAVLFDWSSREAATMGAWMPNQFALRFWSPAVRVLPEIHLRTLIAHEIAHVVYRTYPAFEGEGGYDPTDPFDPEELGVRELNRDWGFDEEAFDDCAAACLGAMDFHWQAMLDSCR